MPFDSQAKTEMGASRSQPCGSPERSLSLDAAIQEVRAFNAKNLALNAYLRRFGVAAERRRLYGIEPPPKMRSATEAEILAIAERLDAGCILNPRVWAEHFTRREPVQ